MNRFAPPLCLRGKAEALPFPLVCTKKDVSDVSPPPWSPRSLEGQRTPTSPSSPALLAAVPGLYLNTGALHSFTGTLFQALNPVSAVFWNNLCLYYFSPNCCHLQTM